MRTFKISFQGKRRQQGKKFSSIRELNPGLQLGRSLSLMILVGEILKHKLCQRNSGTLTLSKKFRIRMKNMG